MKKTSLTMMTLAAMAMAALTFGDAAASSQQATDRPDSVRQGTGMNHGQGMMQDKGAMKSSQAMEDTEQALAKAYLTTLHTFANTLRTQGNRASVLDREFARTAVAEMRRSFDQMQDRHQLFIKSMSKEETSATEGTMKQMRTDHGKIEEHLVALETEVEESTLDSKAVMKHTDMILASCKAMTEMQTAATGPKSR